MLFECICGIITFIIGAGIGCGVVLVTTGSNDHHDQTKTVAAATNHSSSKNSGSLVTSNEVIFTVKPTHLPTLTATTVGSSAVVHPVVTTRISHVPVTTTNSFGVITPALTSFTLPTSIATTASTIHRFPHSVTTTTTPQVYLATSTASSTLGTHSVSTTISSPTHDDSTHLVVSTTRAIATSSPTRRAVTTATSSTHSTHSAVSATTSSSTHSSHPVSTTRVTTTTFAPAHRVTTITPSPTPRIVQPNIVNSDILSYINTAYDPCEDFYRYSCGHWYNPRYGARQWGTANELALSNYHKIAEYLSSYVSYRDPIALKKAKYIYSACTNTDYIQSHLSSKIQDFMKSKAGGWESAGLNPANSWSINNLYKDHYLGSTAFFQFGITPDDLNSSLPVIRVSNSVFICM